jgi:hypothetical protein
MNSATRTGLQLPCRPNVPRGPYRQSFRQFVCCYGTVTSPGDSETCERAGVFRTGLGFPWDSHTSALSSLLCHKQCMSKLPTLCQRSSRNCPLNFIGGILLSGTCASGSSRGLNRHRDSGHSERLGLGPKKYLPKEEALRIQLQVRINSTSDSTYHSL